MRNVTMVVPVLMMSCQVSEYARMGPVTSQIRMVNTASPKAPELPAQAVAQHAILAGWVNCEQQLRIEYLITVTASLSHTAKSYLYAFSFQVVGLSSAKTCRHPRRP